MHLLITRSLEVIILPSMPEHQDIDACLHIGDGVALLCQLALQLDDQLTQEVFSF